MTNDYEDTIAVIEKLVQKILDDSGIIGPPVDPQKIAKKLKIPFTESEISGRRGQNFVLNGHRVIDINKDDRPERKCFTLAHELIEILLPPEFISKDERHDIALVGAPYVLMPTEWFHDACVVTKFDIFKLKEIFSTASHEAVAVRTLAFAPGIITVIDDKKVTNRQSSMPGFSGKKLMPIEKKAADEALTTGERVSLKSSECETTAYPLLNEEVKRIILRTIPLSDYD
jgi:Zn-dependent peptidase ImmA (M78 family)